MQAGVPCEPDASNGAVPLDDAQPYATGVFANCASSSDDEADIRIVEELSFSQVRQVSSETFRLLWGRKHSICMLCRCSMRATNSHS